MYKRKIKKMEGKAVMSVLCISSSFNNKQRPNKIVGKIGKQIILCEFLSLFLFRVFYASYFIFYRNALSFIFNFSYT